MSRLDDTPWLHITSQFYEHAEAYVTGTRQGLKALRDALDAAIAAGDAKATVFATDGEGYSVVVRLSNTVAGLGEPVYFETIARNAYQNEVKLHEHIVRDRRRKKATPHPAKDTDDASEAELLALAERCEKASGQDWSLNNAIWIIVGEELGGEWSPKTITPIKPSEIIAGSAMVSAFTRFPDDPGGIAFSWRVPDFSGSLDAAMTLVPEGLSFEVRRSGTGDAGQSTVWDPMRAVGIADWRVTGCQSPALALCAAALKARAATMGGSDD